MRIKSHKIITDPIDRDFLKICISAYLDKIYLHDDQINYKNCTHTHTYKANTTYIQWNFSKRRNIMQIEKRTALENWLSLG